MVCVVAKKLHIFKFFMAFKILRFLMIEKDCSFKILEKVLSMREILSQSSH